MAKRKADDVKEDQTSGVGSADAASQGVSDEQSSQEDSTPQPDAVPPPDKMNVVGSALWLMTNSPAHKHIFVADFEWLVLPPIALGQFYLWRRQNVPVGLATWAFLNNDVEERLKRGIRRLAPLEWTSGENLWLIDFIVPFGGKEAALADLREKVFKDKKAKTLRPASDGKGFTVIEI